MNKFFSTLLTTIYLITLYNCNEKQVKVDACMKITKARIAQDSSLVTSIIDMLATESDKEEATNKIITLTLLSCYQRITFFRADEINRDYRDFKKIDSRSEELKELLGLERWADVFSSNDQEKFNNEMDSLQDALRDIKSGDLNFEGFNQPNSETEENYPNEAQDIHYDREKKVDFNIFGFNFTQLNSTYKNVIGLSLIFLIFFTIIYLLNWIKSLRQKVVKKSKKTKTS